MNEPKRVVATLTTLPKRLFNITATLDSLLNQTFKLNKIYLNIPFETLKGEKYVFSPEFKEYLNKNKKIEIIRGIDYGPITKIIPTLEIENDPETIIISFDDDIIVNPRVVEIFLEKSNLYPNSALSFSGWCIGKFPFYFQFVGINNKDVEVDVLQGVHGIFYKRKFLDKEKLLKKYNDEPEYLNRHDDHRISAYLSSEKIPKISINHNYSKYFRNIDHIKKIDAISGTNFLTSKRFILQVANIMNFFSNKNLYNKNSSPFTSVFFWITIIIVYCSLIFILFKSKRNAMLLILISLIILYLSIKIYLENYKAI